jgi:AcrR family transcriptional regulator
MVTSLKFPTDGRLQRSERSRTAIVQAMLDLIGEGTLSPTAQQVAEQADVGVRTVFRHFSDMETLFAAMNGELTREVSSLFIEKTPAGSFSERVDGLIERRTTIFSRLAPYVRSSTLQRWRSAFLQAEHERTTKTLRRDLHRWLPELETAPTEVSDALEMTLSFEAWNRLRVEQRLGLRRTAGVMRLAVTELMRNRSCLASLELDRSLR